MNQDIIRHLDRIFELIAEIRNLKEVKDYMFYQPDSGDSLIDMLDKIECAATKATREIE